MSLLEKLCKELGVEIGEEWTGIGVHQYPQKYAIDHNTLWIRGTYGFKNRRDWEEASMADYVALIKGRLKPVWEPKEGEQYYVPSISMEDKYISLTWTDTEGDRKNQERGAVFKTKEEAINMTEKILDFIKEEINNE